MSQQTTSGTIGSADTMFPDLTLAGFAANLTAATIWNVIGGAVLVAGAYWLLYRRPAAENS